MTKELKENLTRYKIESLADEMATNRISMSRRKDIERFFNKHLGKGPYYAICYYNEGMKSISVRGYLGKMARNYKSYLGNESYTLSAATGDIEGHKFPIIVQEIYPKTTYEFYNFDRYTVYYVNEKFLDQTE